MELRDIISMVRSSWLGIAVLVVVGLLFGGLLTAQTPASYQAHNTVMVNVLTGDSITDLNLGSTYAARQVATFAELARSPKVLQPVADDLGLTETPQHLARSIQTAVQGDTSIVTITATRPSANGAAQIADQVAAELTKVVDQLSPVGANGTPTVTITSISPAVVPTAPASPSLSKNLALGGLIGLVLGIGWAVMRRTLDTKVRQETDVRALTEAPLLGTVAYDPKASGRKPTVVAPLLSVRAEQYRQLRTNLYFVRPDSRPRSIVVTSSRGGEGKSVTAINLALAMAESGTRVCVVDADLRRPRVAGYLGLEGAAGLTTVLIGRATLDDVIQPLGVGDISVVTSGRVPPNPSELLGSDVMRKVLTELTSRFELVIFDAAPLLPVTDAAILSKITDGVLLVVGAGIATRDHVRQSIEKLATIGGPLLGVMLNRATRHASDARHYGYRGQRIEIPVDESAPASAPLSASARDSIVDDALEDDRLSRAQRRRNSEKSYPLAISERHE